jgi:hypothetical protein
VKSKKLQILSIASLFLLAFFVATPTDALAVVQSLNNSSAQNQSFVNDINVTISTNTGTGVHTLGWGGQLPVSRGGTGSNSFTTGSVLFSNGTSIIQDNSNLFWDDTNNRLGIGTSSPNQAFDVRGDAYISGDLSLGDTNGGGHHIYGVNAPNGSGSPGGSISIRGGAGSSSGGNIEILSGNGGDGSAGQGNGGNLYLIGGDAGGGNANGGNVEFKTGLKTGSGQDGVFRFWNLDRSSYGNLDFSSITSPGKTFSFPNTSGTFGLLEAAQTFTGLNKFEATSNSTVYVGSSTRTGCIALGDSDGSGITYVTVNDGVMTASITKPSTCQ